VGLEGDVRRPQRALYGAAVEVGVIYECFAYERFPAAVASEQCVAAGVRVCDVEV
jgi:hypothetical protein